jgi:PIN domain nuclease of toxin-antitoxin system
MTPCWVYLQGVRRAGAARYTSASLGGEHAAKVVELPPIHRDPFDRLLVAQAWVEPMILLTDDATLGGYGDFVEVI